MFVVIFELQVNAERRDDYLAIATALRADVDRLDGFLGIERFQNVADARRMVSISTWRDEDAVARWRAFGPHRKAQEKGRAQIFDDYRLRVGEIVEAGADVEISEGADLSGRVPGPKPADGPAAPAAPVEPAGPVGDREILETLAMQINPSGTLLFRGAPRLLISNKPFEIGTRFGVTYNNQAYELELTAIGSTTFTLRFRSEEITRPIRPIR